VKVPREETKRCLTVWFLSEDWRLGLSFLANFKRRWALPSLPFRQGRLVNAFPSFEKSASLFLWPILKQDIQYFRKEFLFEISKDFIFLYGGIYPSRPSQLLPICYARPVESNIKNCAEITSGKTRPSMRIGVVTLGKMFRLLNRPQI
jgi:hypothetical protein